MTQVGPGRIEFPGVVVPLRCEFTLGHGCHPSQGFLEWLGQPGSVPAEGTLALSCDGARIEIRNARLGAVNYTRDNRGVVASAQVLDRRWKWEFGSISGSYNVLQRNSQEEFEPGTERSPRELLRLLFESLGEKTVDVSQVPDDLRPPVVWDYASPREEIYRLCELLNCRVVLTLRDQVKVVSMHRGATLPNSPTALADSTGVDPREPPEVIRVVGAPTLYEVRLALRAVGPQIDGEIVEVDKLSYKPPGPWEEHDPNYLWAVSDNPQTRPDGSKVRPRDIAQGAVWRWFQIVDEIRALPGYSDDRHGVDPGNATSSQPIQRWQLLPLGNSLVQTFRDRDGVRKPLAAFVEGTWCHNRVLKWENSAPFSRIDLPFSIDAANGVVQFAEPVFRLSDDKGKIKFPELYLRVAVEVRDSKTRVVRRFTLDESTNRDSKRIRLVPRDDVQFTRRAIYDGGNVTSVVDNESDVTQVARYYLRNVVDEYNTLPTLERPYVGLMPIEPDGAIQQVTWTIGDGPTYTRASRGFEHSVIVPTYQQARDASLRRALADERERFAKERRK